MIPSRLLSAVLLLFIVQAKYKRKILTDEFLDHLQNKYGLNDVNGPLDQEHVDYVDKFLFENQEMNEEFERRVERNMAILEETFSDDNQALKEIVDNLPNTGSEL